MRDPYLWSPLSLMMFESTDVDLARVIGHLDAPECSRFEGRLG